MFRFRKPKWRLLLLVLAAYALFLYSKDVSDLPPLQDGDLIFQTTWTNQSVAVALASGSLYLHTGIIKNTDDGPVVIHAGGRVEEQPLSDWVAGGIWERFSVYRYKDLTQTQRESIVQSAKRYYGQPYDLFFLFDNDRMYCSELPYLTFKNSSIELGQVEKIGDLSVNNRFAKKVIEQRWRSHPLCQSKDETFEKCYGTIMNQSLITPASIANDKHLERIFSNYP